MRMNVQPMPNAPDRVNEIRQLTATIVSKEILPHENTLWGWRANSRVSEAEVQEARQLRERIKEKVKSAASEDGWFGHSVPLREPASSAVQPTLHDPGAAEVYVMARRIGGPVDRHRRRSRCGF